MNNVLIFAFLFFIGSCLGWCMEVFFRRFFSKANPERKWINPGFLSGPYLPLYGFGLWGMYAVSALSSVAMTPSKALDVVIILVIMAAVMTIIEYIAGIIFIRGMHVKLWDYTKEKGNIQGIICPKFSIIWGMLGCVYYFLVNPYVVGWVNWLSQHLAFSFFIGMFFGVFAIDLWYSLNISGKVRQFAQEKNVVVKYEELKEYLAQQREELEEKKHFLLVFKTEQPLSRQLEKYSEHMELLKKQAEKLKQVKENIKSFGDEVKNELEERKEELMEDHRHE